LIRIQACPIDLKIGTDRRAIFGIQVSFSSQTIPFTLREEILCKAKKNSSRTLDLP
jgi:hypothetical protein